MMPRIPMMLALSSLLCTFSCLTAVSNEAATKSQQGSIGGVAAEEAQPSAAAHTIEVVFVLDTTGSMAGLINAAKEKIWAIAGTLGTADPAPQIRLGLVGYRDRGDDYVTKMTPLTSDLDAVYSALMDFDAAGGNDTPESVNQALVEAVHQTKWTEGGQTYRVIFLVGDAPPHMDYDDDVKYQESCKAAAERGIYVNTIQCGNFEETTPIWKDIAGRSDGAYAAIDASGGALVPETPFDAKLAELSKSLDETRIYYGSGEVKMQQEAKRKDGLKIYDNASLRSVAQRAVFNCCPSGKANFCGSQELVNDFLAEKIALKDLKKEDLPESIQKLSDEELTALLRKNADERKSLQTVILSVSKERQEWVRKELEKMGAAQPELDRTIFQAIQTQAATRGINFKAAAPSL